MSESANTEAAKDISFDELMSHAAAVDQQASEHGIAAVIDTPIQRPVKSEQTPTEAPKPEETKPAEDEPKSDGKSSLNQDDKAEAKTTENADEAPKSKWKQNEERKAKTWEQINAEKEQIRLEREKFQREREEFERQRVATSEKKEFRDDHGFTAKEYADYAKQIRDKDPQQAEAAEKRAGELRQKEAQYRQQLAAKSIEDGWNKSFEQAVARLPDLKDANSDVHKEVLATLQKYPELKQSPKGLEAAIERAEFAVKARQADAKESTIKELQEKLSKLEKKLSIGPGSPDAKLSEPKKFSELSSAEQFKRLEQAFREADDA